MEQKFQYQSNISSSFDTPEIDLMQN